MSGLRRDVRRRSRHGLRQRKRRILAVCLGRRTERDYLDALTRAFPQHATVVIRTRDTDPGRCLDYAISQGSTGENVFDEVWCVFDVDEYNIDNTGRRAKRAGVELAVSNPCFELWLLLHLVETTRYFADYKEVARELAKLVTYNKSRIKFEHFMPGIDDAIDRARRLEEKRDSQQEIPNPSSGMWRLAARIVRR